MSDILPRHRVEADRLDQMQAAVWTLHGDATAVDAVRRLVERRARLLGLVTATEVPGTVVTAETLADQIRDFSRRFNLDEPRPARLYVGRWVQQLLWEMAAKPGQPPWDLSALHALYAVPIVPDDGDPLGWRLVGTDGIVIKEGRITPSALRP